MITQFLLTHVKPLTFTDTVVQMSGSTCSNSKRKLPEIQDTKIQEFFYMPSSVDQLQKESTMIKSEVVDDDTTDDKLAEVIHGLPVSYVEGENVIDIEKDRIEEVDDDPTEDKLPVIIEGIPVSYVDSENIIDIEKDSLPEVNVVDNSSYNLVMPKTPKQKYLYSYVVPQIVFPPLLMSYNHHQPHHYYHYPFCFPYCKL